MLGKRNRDHFSSSSNNITAVASANPVTKRFRCDEAPIKAPKQHQIQLDQRPFTTSFASLTRVALPSSPCCVEPPSTVSATATAATTREECQEQVAQDHFESLPSNSEPKPPKNHPVIPSPIILPIDYLPLTAANLLRLNMARTPSPNKKSTNTNPRHKLGDYNIRINRKEQKPADLDSLITELLRPRDPVLQVSPNAKEVARKQAAAAEMSEVDAVSFIERDALLLPAKEGGQTFLESCKNQNLARNFLPTPLNSMAGSLEQAQPDTAYGYMRESIATKLSLQSPFTFEEDHQLARFPLCDGLHAPFFTCQWKGAKNANHYDAATQGARDGAVIVNYLRWMYTTASPSQEPTSRDTCHFSATCDFSTLIIFVHWASVSNGVTCYHMDELDDFQLKKESSFSSFRTFFRNLQDHARTQRLDRIKSIIPDVTAAMQSKRAKLPDTPPDSTAASDSASVVASCPSIASSASAFDPVQTLTPTSNSAQFPRPLSKRQRTNTSELGHKI